MTTLDIAVVGIGAWAVGHQSWPQLRDALRHPGRVDATDHATQPSRPALAILPPAERRRTPDGVAVAIQVAREAVAACGAGIDSATLASVFASAHGDLAIVDYLCRTLACDATSLSPTRFHLSVHNAAAGYWSIAMKDMAPTSATAGGDDTFALGLVEAATLAVAESRPVLLVAFDTPAAGLLAAAVGHGALFGFAMVLRPATSDDIGARLSLTIDAGVAHVPLPRDPRMRALALACPAARALSLAEAIATGSDAPQRYPIGGGVALGIRVRTRVPLAPVEPRAIG